jgi:exopolyphosphatase / guanosine-5'-triphosphate,3'-diphosphate pyrophosphatase
MRIATVDLGTNTILLLVADVEPPARLAPVTEVERFVRLGEGVDASGRITAVAVDRVMAALAEYVRLAHASGAAIVTIAGTSASRDAGNVVDLARRIREVHGLDFEVISGHDEALWAFRGALAAYPDIPEACVLDVGGGSTELVWGPAGDGLPERVSLDIGSVRLTERFFADLPPGADVVERAEAVTREHLGRVAVRPGLPLVGTAGTVAALARLATPRQPGQPLPADTVRAWRDRLLSLSAEEVRALDPEIMTGRADVIAAGVLIVAAVMDHLGAEMLLPSPYGLRHGLALRWLAARPGA